MALNLYGRPFTQAIVALRRGGKRYEDLSDGCLSARSTTWFNKLVNSESPWVNSPPDEEALVGLAILLRVTVQRAREMVVEEWYGVRPQKVSARVSALASRLDELTEERAGLVEKLVQELQPEPAH